MAGLIKKAIWTGLAISPILLAGCDYLTLVNVRDKYMEDINFTKKFGELSSDDLSNLFRPVTHSFSYTPEFDDATAVIEDILSRHANIKSASKELSLYGAIVYNTDRGAKPSIFLKDVAEIFSIMKDWGYSKDEFSQVISLLDSEEASDQEVADQYLSAVKILDEGIYSKGEFHFSNLKALVDSIVVSHKSPLVPRQIATNVVQLYEALGDNEFLPQNELKSTSELLKRGTSMNENLDMKINTLVEIADFAESNEIFYPEINKVILNVVSRTSGTDYYSIEFMNIINEAYEISKSKNISLTEVSSRFTGYLESRKKVFSTSKDYIIALRTFYTQKSDEIHFEDLFVKKKETLESELDKLSVTSMHDVERNPYAFEDKKVHINGYVDNVAVFDWLPGYKSVGFNLYDNEGNDIPCAVKLVPEDEAAFLTRQLNETKDRRFKISARGTYKGGDFGSLGVNLINIGDLDLKYFTEVTNRETE